MGGQRPSRCGAEHEAADDDGVGGSRYLSDLAGAGFDWLLLDTEHAANELPMVYTQLQAADALRDAAQNPSGGAGLTAGIGAGMGIGNVLSQSLQGIGNQNKPGQAEQSPGGGGPAAPSGGGMADVMTPAEAAAALRVSEEDVLAAIQAGDLKARKIGSAYRISREALEAFLKG